MQNLSNRGRRLDVSIASFAEKEYQEQKRKCKIALPLLTICDSLRNPEY